MDLWIFLIKPGLDVLKTGVKSLRNNNIKKKYNQTLSTITVELLKEDPDIDYVEAELKTLEAVSTTPSKELSQVRKMLSTIKDYHETTRKVRVTMEAKRGVGVSYRMAKKRFKFKKKFKKKVVRHKKIAKK